MRRIVASVVAVCLAGALGFGIASYRTGSSPVAKPSVMQLIDQRSAEELPKLAAPDQLDRYLARLEAEARQKKRPTALEVEPGLRAIALFRSQLGDEAMLAKKRAFIGTMHGVAASSGGTP